MQSFPIKFYHLQTLLLSLQNTVWEKKCISGKQIFSWFSSATTGRKMQYFSEKYYHIACSWGISRRNTTKMLFFEGIRTSSYKLNIYQQSYIWVVYSLGFLVVVIALERVPRGNGRNSFIWWRTEGHRSANMKSKFLWNVPWSLVS